MIPQETLNALDRYVNHRIPTGDFLRAALENNFVNAVCYADEENTGALVDIAQHIYNELPSACWGSREAVKKWLTSKS